MIKTKSSNESLIIPEEVVMNQIYYIRDQKVMLDRDLAELYGVETRALKQAVRRNIERFPEDFMFEVTNCDLKRRSRRNTLLTIYQTQTGLSRQYGSPARN